MFSTYTDVTHISKMAFKKEKTSNWEIHEQKRYEIYLKSKMADRNPTISLSVNWLNNWIKR